MHVKSWSERLTVKDHAEDLGVDGRILEWILRKEDSGWILKVCSCEHGNEALGSIKGVEFLE